MLASILMETSKYLTAKKKKKKGGLYVDIRV